jgi:hydrogenase maturation protease
VIVRVLGLGNVLMQDDGFGPFVVEYLRAHYVFPPGVEVVDVGTPGLDLIPYVTGAEALIFVDTIKARAAPGEVRSYRKSELLARPPGPRVGPHDPGVKEALLIAEVADEGARDVLLVGVVPQEVGYGTVLTPPVQRAVDRAATLVAEELRRLGYGPTRRVSPLAVEPWWTRQPAAVS